MPVAEVTSEVRKAYDIAALDADAFLDYEHNRFIAWHKKRIFVRALELLGKYCDLSRRNRLLNVGCGDGESIEIFYSIKQLELFGVDISENMLSLAQRRLKPLRAGGRKIRLLRGNVEDMSFFPDDCFDVVYEFGVLYLLPNPRRAYSEYLRVTKPGGILLLETAPRWSMGHLGHLFKPVPGDWFGKPNRLKKLMFWRNTKYYHFYTFSRILDFLNNTHYAYEILGRVPLWFYYLEGRGQRVLNKLSRVYGDRLFDKVDNLFRYVYRIPAGYFLVLRKR